MKTDRRGSLPITILSLLMGLLFLFSGSTKLAGMQMHVEHFAHWGYPQWFRLVVGAVEVAGGAALLVPRFAFIAACALAINMTGEVYTELFRGEAPRALFPLVLLILLSLVAYARRAGVIQVRPAGA